MNKQTKVLLAIAVLGAAGYFYWKSQQTTTTPKANATGCGCSGK
jgi:predicted negative regulator of RcsB-dependent stress response